MQPDWELTKALVRYKGVAESLLASGSGPDIWSHVVGLIKAIQKRLAQTNRPNLAAEFNQIVAHHGRDSSLAHVTCSALAGWLQGAIDAESLEVRIQAEATAYAETRVRAERPIGFAAPPSAEE